MALHDKDILITPNRGQSSDPKIEFKAADATIGPKTITLNVYPASNGTLSFEGSAGQLFSITNELTGTIFSVNDISGIPTIEVQDTGLVKIAQYSGNVLLGTGVDNAIDKLQVNGSITASQSIKSSLFIGPVQGNASTATTANNLTGFTNSNSSTPIPGPDAQTGNGIGYVQSISLLGQIDGALYSQAYSTNWVHQIYGDYRTGQIALRGKNNGTWQSWRTVIDTSNYNTYVPTLTGGGASGTWGISITGSAANSDLLDGRDSTHYLYGQNQSGSNTASATQNIYELAQYKSGFWDVSDASWTPSTDFWWGATFAHASNSSSYNYSGQLAFKNGGGGDEVYARTISAAVPSQWSRLLSSTNYNSYAPTLTGGGASGTWGISITGTAATLTTGRTIGMTGDVTWTSDPFNGSANVTGTATLANSGVTVGTYTKVTVDAKGRVTTGSSLTASDIPELTMSNLPGAAYKQSVKCATTANITLSGTQTIDGISVVADDRVLVKNQTTASQNGIYIVASGTWTRAADADTSQELGAAIVAVDSGTTNGGELWTTTFRTTDTLGTTAMNWYEVLYNTGTWGISITGSAATLTTGRTINGTSFNGSANITTANWGTARTLSFTGDVTGSSSVNGSANVATAMTLANSGVTAGTYTKVTVDAKGRVTTGSSLSSADLPTYTGTLTLSQVTSALGYTPGQGDVTTTGTQTLTNKTLSGAVLNDGYTEEVFAVTGTTPALSPTNGSIQTWTLSGNSTPTAGTWNAGQSITLMVDDGTARTITWTSLAVTWKTDGGSAPTLNTTGFTAIALWKVGSVIYGARVGDA